MLAFDGLRSLCDIILGLAFRSRPPQSLDEVCDRKDDCQADDHDQDMSQDVARVTRDRDGEETGGPQGGSHSHQEGPELFRPTKAVQQHPDHHGHRGREARDRAKEAEALVDDHA